MHWPRTLGFRHCRRQGQFRLSPGEVCPVELTLQGHGDVRAPPVAGPTSAVLIAIAVD